MNHWRNEMIRWRCGLKREEVTRLRGETGPWNCRDLKFTITRVSFEQLDADRAKPLNDVPTTFTLPDAPVDEVIRAGGGRATGQSVLSGISAGQVAVARSGPAAR